MRTMKTLLKKMSIGFFTVSVLFLQSCSSDDDSGGVNNENQLEEATAVAELYHDNIGRIVPPIGLENNALSSGEAAATVAFIKGNTTFTRSFSVLLISVPDFAVEQKSLQLSKAPTTWTWSDGVSTVFYTLDEDGEFLNFTYRLVQGGLEVVKIEGRLREDGNYAKYDIFAEGEVATVTYEKAGDQVSFINDFENERTEMDFDESDLSGEIRYYQSGSLEEIYTWRADGSGTYRNNGTGETISWP